VSTAWGRHDDREAAVTRILDAADRLHLQAGVAATTMADVAAEAGCSRATLYLYFPNKEALRTAMRARAATEIAAEAARATVGIDDPRDRIVEAVTWTMRRVRETPSLQVWFEPDNLALTQELANASEIVTTVAGEFTRALGDTSGVRAKLLVRLIISLLAAPARSADEERALVALVLTAPA
jgi:AcrR family transcriptional regulator